MRVDIWSDIVCPWCYIGKRRFEQALQALGQRDQVEVVHHSFELDPSMDRGQTVQLMDMLAAKYRLNPAQASEAESRVAATAAADGLGYTSDRPVGNTFDAHRLVHLAADRGGRGDAAAPVRGPFRRGQIGVRHRRADRRWPRTRDWTPPRPAGC